MFTIDPNEKIITFQDARIPGGLNFDSQEGLASLAADKGWNKELLTDIWNEFAGTPEFNDCREQKCFKNRSYGVNRIWCAIQRLSQPITARGNGHKPIVVAAEDSQAPVQTQEAAELPAADAQAAPTAPQTTKTPKGSTRKPKAPKAPKAPKPANVKKPKAPKPERTARKDSKKAEVIRLLQRKNGASIAEIVASTGWKPWTSRGFIFGSCKKAGLIATSEKPEGSKERRYYLPAAK